MTYLSKANWEKTAAGFAITDCSVRTRSVVALCLRRNTSADAASMAWDHDVNARVLVVNLASDGSKDESYFSRTLAGYNKPRLGVTTQPLQQTLLAARNSDGQVSVMGGGRKFADEFIDPGKFPMPVRIKTLAGYAYSVGGGRSIYKRADVNKWVKLDKGFPVGDATMEQGFEDMDAFSDSDMYAVGGHGDVWHFDGQSWKQMGFPSNAQLGTVTCAGDGNVYISGEGGSLWVGQKSTWKSLYKGRASILWNDVVWFDGKLWLSSDYQFRIWDGKELVGVMHEGKAVPIYGHMDARDGLLAVASPQFVMTFDGNTWRTIVAPYL